MVNSCSCHLGCQDRYEIGEPTDCGTSNEKPPSDGHRKNILKPFHKRVGVGIAQPAPTPTEIPVPCFSQEFIDPYGRYAPIPTTLHPGQMLHVEGSALSPATVAGLRGAPVARRGAAERSMAAKSRPRPQSKQVPP